MFFVLAAYSTLVFGQTNAEGLSRKILGDWELNTVGLPLGIKKHDDAFVKYRTNPAISFISMNEIVRNDSTYKYSIRSNHEIDSVTQYYLVIDSLEYEIIMRNDSLLDIVEYLNEPWYDDQGNLVEPLKLEFTFHRK